MRPLRARERIAQQHHLDYDIHAIPLPNMDAAKLWMIEHQLGQRNLNDKQSGYYIGKHFELSKKVVGRPNGNYAKVAQFTSTAKEVAVQHKVSERTVHNDAQFTRAVDTIADNIGGEARTEILDGDLNLTRQEVQKLAEIAEAVRA